MKTTPIVLAALLVWPFAARAEGDLVRVKSSHDVATTVQRLQKAIEERGLTLLAHIDHRANARSAGLELAGSELLLFGNPAAGTKLMQRDPAAGLDLPMRLLVFEDGDGATWLVYRDPAALGKDFAVADDPVIGKLQGAMKGLAAAAAE